MPEKVFDMQIKGRALLAFSVYVLVVLLIAAAVYFRNREKIFKELDQRLAAGAASIQYVLDDSFHDRAIAEESISPEEDRKNILLLTDLARKSDFTYLYTVIIKNNEIIVTSSSASEKEIETKSEVTYFTPYNEAYELLTSDKIKKGIPYFVTHTDRWGTFRAGILLSESPSGHPYLAVAEMDISAVSAELHAELLVTLVIAFLLLAASVPLYLVLSGDLRYTAESLKKTNERLIQEQKRGTHLEKKLIQAYKMEALGTLAGGIAHDFNNILASLMGYTELALDEVKKGSETEEYLQEIYTAGKRARDLVKHILAFARQSNEERKPVRIGTIAKEVIKFMRSTIPATIEIQQDISSESLAMGNTTQVHQIIMNLCANAAYAMEEKGGALALELKDVVVEDGSDLQRTLDLMPETYIRLTVSDTGTGISSDIVGSIFEPYFTTKGPGEGTGMGLAMVHGIVESYGGKITVESEVGKGSSFHVYLPATRTELETVSYQSEQLPNGTERILIVDDEPRIAQVISYILSGLGYDVTVCTSSIEALDIFRANPDKFDLIITDMTMPEQTGEKLASDMIGIRPDIPIILSTGYSKNLSEEKILQSGIKALVEKPVLKSDLAKKVRSVLDLGKSGKASNRNIKQ